jgi:hypothetical protein
MLILNKKYTFPYNGVNKTGIYVGTFIIVKIDKYNFSKSFISNKNKFFEDKLKTDYFNENLDNTYSDLLNQENLNIINDDKFNDYLTETNITESDFYNKSLFTNLSIHKYRYFYDETESKIIHYHH